MTPSWTSIPVRLVGPLVGFTALSDFVLVRHDHAVFDLREAAAEPGYGPPPTALPLDAATYELRSLDIPDLHFLAVEGSALFPGYAPDLRSEGSADVLDRLGTGPDDEVLVLVLVQRDGNYASMTANLLAPVVVDLGTRRAAQVILSRTDWPVRAELA